MYLENGDEYDFLHLVHVGLDHAGVCTLPRGLSLWLRFSASSLKVLPHVFLADDKFGGCTACADGASVQW